MECCNASMKTAFETAIAHETPLNGPRSGTGACALDSTRTNMQTSSGVQKRVWVVDDDKAALLSAEEVLAAQGFQVETFSEPVRAIQTVAAGRPDIIVLDVMMPGLDGFEFCRQLRANPVGNDVPVLMATCLDDLQSINQAYEAGATDFTTKPLNWAIETHRLRYMLRSAETARMLQDRERETRMAKEDWERTFNSISDVVTLLSPDLKVLRPNSATATALQKPLESLIGVHYELRTSSGAGAPQTTPTHAQTTVQAQKRVWIVDDDETGLILAEAVLTAEGFQVETFSEPVRAIQAVAKGRPDIIVLDVMMPGLDGFEFCRQLRANPIGHDVPVLMATCLDDLKSINQAYEAGATDFTPKPLNWAIETHRLRYMLRSAETARMLQDRERETRMAKEDWERTFNSISDVVTLLSPDLKVLRANSATATALQKPLESLIGVHCHQLFQDSQEPCRDCPILKVIETGAPASAEKRYRNPAADCLLTGTAVTDEDGRLLHVVHIARDQTEQKQLESEYRHAQKMEAMGTLAGGIAHDFNNLLTVVSGYADLLRKDPQIPPKKRDFSEMIFQAAQRGASLSRQLLTFSRKGTVKSEKHPLRINDLVQDVQKMLQHILPKNVAIHTRFAEDLNQTSASADQLHQVLMNLAVNASHAMSGGGDLTIQTSNARLDPDYCRLHPEIKPGDYVLMAVSDSGHGMDQQTIQRIFEPFFTTKKVGEGTGLGLSVVYGIVKAHDGHILCYSEVGVGTTFKIYLPTLQTTGEATLTQPQVKPALRGGNETILIVDDEAHIRNLLRNCLSNMGYSIITSGDGESALVRQSEEGNRIRMVLLDLGMPGMGGWECLKRLRAINPKLPVLITTGYGGEDLPRRARQEGAVGVVSKPYQMEELCRSVREILDTSQLQRDS